MEAGEQRGKPHAFPERRGKPPQLLSEARKHLAAHGRPLPCLEIDIATTHQGFQAGTATKLLHICKNLKILYWFQGEAKKPAFLKIIKSLSASCQQLVDFSVPTKKNPLYLANNLSKPVVSHKAVAKVSKVGHL